MKLHTSDFTMMFHETLLFHIDLLTLQLFLAGSIKKDHFSFLPLILPF
jgi:hypothetical protein